jgi:colanic acid/amylovoran biosynthesis protein
MPQSFGPFDYTDEKVKYLLCDALNSADCIFAREAEGVDALARIGVDRNVKQSADLVLQSKEVNYQYVFYEKPIFSAPALQTVNNVAVIPNTQLYKYGSKNQVLQTYRAIIEKLLQAGKRVYIFRHSNDLAVCEDIYAMFMDNNHVNIIREEMSCLEYSIFVRQFDFIVASRFHSIVHAYREGIPAFILGWAIKYHNLASLVQQESYVFDGTNAAMDNQETMLCQLEKMLENYAQESIMIRRSIKQIQANNCYDTCDSILRLQGQCAGSKR